MQAAARAFLNQILDYAGLFPPAQLPLDQALRNYLRYRQEPESWMLGRFVCPAARLIELVPFRAEFGDRPLALSVLGRGGKDAKEFFDNVRADLADIQTMQKNLGPTAVAEAYEVRLPAGLFPSPRANQLSALVGTVAYLIETSGLRPLAPFFECPALDPQSVKTLVQVYLDDRQKPDARQRQRCLPPGWKLRCGGQEAAAFPTPNQVALVLAACYAAKIPWKGTAGLHHPFRHQDPDLQTTMHGFLNVFGAGILAHANQMNEVQMEEMLADPNPSHFHLDDTGFAWKDFRATVEQIQAARQHLVTSFGSCSFDEPREDLRLLGWL
jgi:hypothetical protein